VVKAIAKVVKGIAQMVKARIKWLILKRNGKTDRAKRGNRRHLGLNRDECGESSEKMVKATTLVVKARWKMVF
jgi:hypothetical protein